ncbi:hypothetical protein LY474_28895 [Myxococcus stipitatus]|uniref:hypothetical protein n=1 Tax=Myxococcus stipitatus TaxID=83455 RepID=UPI001F3609FE|nr:hypothetical protein [Myxococcus stipitatus]MCE9671831.1 hypothetical protein [Myxococcus stipitatus]
MTSHTSRPSRDDVLDAFAVELNPGRETLERYLRDYPDLTSELVDLSRELSRPVCEDEGPLAPEDEALIDAGWSRHRGATPKPVSPFDALSLDELRDLAKRLEVPRQVITAFRERRVDVASVPRRFLTRLAAALNSTPDLLVSTLRPQYTPELDRSYKSNTKPMVAAPVSFERLLIDAGVPEERRAGLMADDN